MDATRRSLAILTFAGAALACGSHAGEPGAVVVGPPEDRLAVLEKDPSALLAATPQLTYKAMYAITIGSLYRLATPSPGPSGGQIASETITVASRSPDYRWDFDINSPDPVPMDRVIAVLKGTSGFFCVEKPSPVCYVLPQTYFQQTLAALGGSPLDQYRSALKDFDVTVLPRERILGMDTACLRWQPKAAAGTPAPALVALADLRVEACFNADGVVLRSFTGAAALWFDQKATSYTTTVRDADVAVPYAVTSSPFPFPTFASPSPLPTARPAPTR